MIVVKKRPICESVFFGRFECFFGYLKGEGQVNLKRIKIAKKSKVILNC
jgi:hypothetical protein